MAKPWERYAAPQSQAKPWERYGGGATAPDFSDVTSGSSSSRKPRVTMFVDELVAAGLPEGLRQPASYVENALRAARQGATFGFSDEAVGARDALSAGLTGGDPVAAYRQSRDLERARLRQFEEADPVASGLATIGGGLVPIGAPAKAVAAAPSTLSRIGRSIGAGLGTGAVAGLGVGEGDVQQQLKSTGTGALIGGAVSPVVAGGLAGLSRLARLVPRRPVPVAGGTTAQPAGAQAVAAPVDARARALDLVAETMRRSGATPEAIEQQLIRAEELGVKPEVLADFLGDQGARRLYSTRTLGGPASSEAVERLAQRGEGTAARVSEDVQRATEQRGQSLTRLGQSIDNRRRMGNTLYQEAFRHGEVSNPDTLTMLKNPRVAAAMAKASERRAAAAAFEGSKYEPLFRQTDAGPVMTRPPTVEDLHLLKTSLDDDIRQAFKDDEGQLGKAMRDFKNRIVNNLEEEVPAYRKARETYKGDIEVEEAIEAGRADILRKPVDELRRDFAALSGAERDAYRSGAIDTILARKVDPKVDSADFARSLWGNADSRNRLQLLVKNEDELVRLAKQFEREQRIARTNRAVLGGSPTAMRSADIEDQVAGSLADVATQGPQAAFVSTVGRWIRRAGGVTETVADDVARLLTSESPETIRAVLKTLQGREQLRVMQAMRQHRAGGGAASVSAQQTNGTQ